MSVHRLKSSAPRRVVFAFALALLFGLGAAGLVAPVHAAKTRGVKVVRVTQRDGKAVQLYKGSHALLIGVSNYTAGWPDLESVPGEIRRLEKTLLGKGFSVTRVMNPKGEALEKAFESFIDKYGLDPENRLLFFYSGHGYTRKVGRRQKGYLVPTDAPNPNKDEKGFVRQSLSMSKVQTWAREIEAKHALFLFDSCFSGTIFKSRALPAPRHITDKTTRPVRQFITAGSAGEEVPARSVFLPTFIRAIQGGGDINKDGYVTATELGQYLHEKVLGYNSGQTPQYGKIKDPELDEGDFVFVSPAVAKPASPVVAAAAAGAGRPAASPITINAEEEFWNTIKGSRDPLDFKAFLEEFPKGRFSALARLKLRKLGVPSATAKPTMKARTPPPAVAKAAIPAAAPGMPLPRGRAGGIRVAIFPERFAPHLPEAVGLSEVDLANKINGLLLQAGGKGTSLGFNYRHRPKLEQEAWRDNGWEGLFSKDPDRDFVIGKARALGVDAVVMYKINKVPEHNYDLAIFTLYLIDMSNLDRDTYEVSGEGDIIYGTGNWLKQIKAKAEELFEQYRNDSGAGGRG